MFFMIWGVFTDIFGGKKLKTLGGIHESRQKNWNFSDTPLVPRASAPALGLSGVPENFQFIFLSGFIKPPKGSIFASKNIRETPETIKINEPRSQKNEWFPIKTNETLKKSMKVTKKMRGSYLVPDLYRFFMIVPDRSRTKVMNNL